MAQLIDVEKLLDADCKVSATNHNYPSDTPIRHELATERPTRMLLEQCLNCLI